MNANGKRKRDGGEGDDQNKRARVESLIGGGRTSQKTYIFKESVFRVFLLTLHSVCRWQEFSAAEKKHLVEYLAEHSLSKKGRSGNTMYKNLVDDVRLYSI